MNELRIRVSLCYATLLLLSIGATGWISWHAGRAGSPPRSAVEAVALLAAFAVTVAAAVSVPIAAGVGRSLMRLRAAVEAMAGGSVAESSVGGPAEVRALAATFAAASARMHETMVARDEERSRLQALLAASADGIVALDGGGVVRYLNPAARALIGDVSGRVFSEAVRSPEFTALLRSVAASGGEDLSSDDSGETRSALIHLDEREIWLRATVSAIAGAGGWSLLVILHDVTDVRRAETTRRDFVANVSHELRTPLAGIKAVVETLRDGALEDRAVADDFLRLVDDEVDRLVQLVEELLQLARIESDTATSMTEVDAIGVLEECVSRFRPQAERAEVSLRLDVPLTLPCVRGNTAQLGQAVGNLVHNAIKFTPAGGSVTVAAREREDNVAISVSDTGMGIDPADLPRIFERFYVADRARSRRGTGLGLAIVKHVVRAHDGNVHVESQLGRGSTFTVCLPAAAVQSRRSIPSLDPIGDVDGVAG